ncbi:MAG: hypothetical protein IJ935_03195 [Afipia sp.]|nr:hypothetical protein [Afipia sp.]
MSYTAADRDALKAAIASGARRVKFGAGPDSREVEYRTLDDMKRTLADIEAEISPSSRPQRSSFVAHYRD